MIALQGIKNRLKRIGILNCLNALHKANRIKRKYESTARYYGNRPILGTFEELIKKRAGDRLARLRNKPRPLNIFYLGTDELQDRGGILPGLHHVGYVEYFTKASGEYGQKPGLGKTFLSERPASSRRLLDLFERLATAGRLPDILIGQMWASSINTEVLRCIREKYGTLIINICMDDRHAYDLHGEAGMHALIPVLDVAATAAHECVQWYMKEGCPALFFPEASDPAIFHPQPALPKEHEVCFVGGRYGIRERVVNALLRAGIAVTVFGEGWARGPLPTEDVPRLFAQAKIVLGIGTIGHCEDFYSLKMRDFDAPMSGSFYLTHANPDLALMYRVGHEIETYASLEECVSKVRYYLGHEEERETIARQGHSRAVSSHTWDIRFRQFFETIGLTVDTSARQQTANVVALRSM